MTKLTLMIAACSLLAVSAFAQLNETFTYPNGPLIPQSGGAWEKWDPTMSGDATIVNGTAKLEDTTDVMHFFTDAFASSPAVNVSFDINVDTSNSVENYQIFFGSSTSPGGGTPGTNYNSGLLLEFDINPGTAPGTPPSTGNTWLGAQDDNGGVDYAQMSVGSFHHFNIVMVKAASTVSYNLFIDNALTSSYSSTFSLGDVRGMNSVEMYTGLDGTAAAPNSAAFIDNLKVTTIVPEPSSIAAIVTGILGIIGFKRRQ